MISVSIIHLETTIAFFLCFSRWLAVTIQLPLFDNLAVPSMVKVLFTLILAYAFFPFVQGTIISEVKSIGVENSWVLVVLHTLIGLVIGFMVKSIMGLFISTGSLITQQIGFGSISYFDPTHVTRVGPFEKLIEWTLLILILTTGALIPMFKGIHGSFETINLFELGKITQGPAYFLDFMKSLFVSSIMLATPILFTNLLLNIVLGIVARTVPQMNILMISFVVNIGIGLIVFLAIGQEFFTVGFEMYQKKLADWFQYIS